ncbi:Failed axon connections-like protein [Trichoplax sp. H2]|uniref:GST N-terminal domain-containing protein n=1 Tax=Trichoplax adhaerens TaxID=10228 RepID=B3S446_TRIAD|nr:hypothetical protein TRIADDRAFT_28706 [Trichoplax adhaerens]EDV22397.1 hypothetical protein TRIADDRAFT_28706 [Trichoplax adhaerens]RDD42125.1 Failed axon connections-like protein [Trichoplax sp. H2]|eukprot:XP_002114941.1 hypothetical protein TRIADDRAFT_28706 [Trichoplax adhaerens]
MSSSNDKVDKDTVVVYQFIQGLTAPSLSPFVLKLETYLRMAKLNYVCDYGGKVSKKGKIPWIAIDGKEIADSAFCVQYLNKRFNIDLDSHLNESQKAIAHAYIKMLEENTFWAVIVQTRAIENFPWALNEFNVPKYLKVPAKLTFRRKVTKAMWGHGIGRHSQEEIHDIGNNDLRACSSFLADKKFFMGDQPSFIDAVMFGFLGEIVYALPPDCWYARLVDNEFKNLKAYCDRMKEEYWPDWDSKLRSPKAN